MRRSEVVDIMKGICIILVVIGHYIPEDAPEWYHSIVKCIYSFHMPLFMFLSGWLYCATLRPNESYIGFMRRKTLRLMVPYLFASVVIIGFKTVIGTIITTDHPVELSRDLPAMFYGPSAAYFLWFLWALWLIFFVAATLKSIRARNIFLVVSIILSLLPIKWPGIFCLRQTIEMLPYFAIGMSVFDHRRLLIPVRRSIKAISSGAVILFISLYVLTLTIDNTLVKATLQYCVALSAIVAVGSLAVIIAKRFKAQIIITVGIASFAIYLFHTTFEGLVKGLLQQSHIIHNDSDLLFTIGAFIVIVTGIIVPVLLHRHIFGKNRWLAFLTATPLSISDHNAKH